MQWVTIYTALAAVVDTTIIVGLGYRILMRRRPVGVTLAWIAVIVSVPFLGALVYLAFGESNVGDRAEIAQRRLLPAYRKWLAVLPRDAAVDWSGLSGEAHKIHRLAVGTVGIPTLSGNRVALLDDAEVILRAMIRDVDAASETVHMEFFIWSAGGTADEVAEALLRAAARGVVCRVLLDSIGSSDFFPRDVAKRMRDGGVHLVEALPTGLIRGFVRRADHRMHRKVVVIDGTVAYTGSLNIVDPRFFKQSSGVGQWIDAMARVEGPAVEAIAVSFIADWEFETGEGIGALAKTIRVPPTVGAANVQVFPSGPGYKPEAIHKMLLMTIYAAREEVILTTPYFVPSEALLTALQSAAQRDVAVTIVLPAKNDSFLVQYAGRSTYEDLLAAGVRIARFTGGLLHTKSITVDGETSVFGSVNLDMRSFYINFEISIFVYDRTFTQELRALQEHYIADSELLEAEEWESRPTRQKFVESLCNLASPLL